MISQQVFVHVESHEMKDVESNKLPNHLYPDAESEQELRQQIWADDDVKDKSVGSVA